MKHLLLASLLVFSFDSVCAQATSAKADEYCILSARYKTQNHAQLDLYFASNVTQAQRLEEAEKIKGFEYEMDAVDYLASHNWELISVTPRSYTGTSSGVRYYLRRHQP